MLRPGFFVGRRDGETLQVGLDRRAVLPDRPEVRAVLSRLEAGVPLTGLGPAADEVSQRLRSMDMLVDDADVRRGPAAVHATHGSDGARRLRARRAASVSVLALDDASRDLAAAAERMLRSAGVADVSTGDPAATLALVLASGEPAREHLDGLMVLGQPHLLVGGLEGAVRLGPLVVPGTTACLRCVDAELQCADDRRGVVLAQVVDRAGPLDLATAEAAVGLAVRDVCAYLDGDRPMTWSATFTLGGVPTAEGLAPRRWRRHPHCGCCWDALLDP